MENKVIYNFIKNIIDNGINNNLSVSKVKKGIKFFLSSVKSQCMITDEEATKYERLSDYLPLIMQKEITLEEAYIEILENLLIEEKQEKKVYSKGSYKPIENKTVESSSDCGTSSYVKYDRCGESINDCTTIDYCSTAKYGTISDSCGDSRSYYSNSSCGSSRTSGRC